MRGEGVGEEEKKTERAKSMWPKWQAYMEMRSWGRKAHELEMLTIGVR